MGASMEPIPREIASITRPVPELLHYYFLKALASTLGFPITMPILYFRYHTMRYAFTDEGISMSWGILFRHQIMLNYSRIQDIHVRSNAIERWLGLAQIEIQTASGASAEMTLEGLTDPAAMRNFLYSRMRGAADHKKQRTTESDHLTQVLEEVAAELKAIRLTLEGRKSA